MNLSEKLEIFIPTYNRKPYIKHTLTQLTAADSPVKDCSITVLDNASEDGSSEVIADFAARFSNVTHIRHPKNIGANANIARCFELATAPFVWAVCDDDSFRWDSWHEIQEALESDQYDIMLTSTTQLRGTNDIAKIIRQLTFVPAGIFRTKFITGAVLINMYNNVANLFPHLALSCEIINKKGSIFLPQRDIIADTALAVGDIDNYLKGTKKTTYTPQSAREMFWTPGFFNSLQLLEDEKLRTYVKNHLGRHGFFGYLIGAFRQNYTKYNSSKINVRLMINNMNLWQRFQFFWVRVFLRITTFFHRKK